MGLIELRSGDGKTSVTPQVGKVRKFNIETFKQEEPTAEQLQAFVSSTFDSGECDNFILEMHYNIIFELATQAQSDQIVHPPEYGCAEGAIQDKEIFCPEFDICAQEPTPKYDYFYQNTTPPAGTTLGRCANYPWCEENYQYGASE